MRIPLATDLIIDGFGGGDLSDVDAGITNGMVDKDGGRVYVTQRPSFDLFEDASDEVSDAKGRGVYYWEETGSVYFINNGTIYKSTHANAISTLPGSGVKKCTFLEVNGSLVLIDVENNQAFTISSGDVVAEITDTDFPPKQAPAVQLAYGGTTLDGYFVVMGEDAIVYNSNLGDPTTWNALDKKGAERRPGEGVYLGRHYDNLVALKANSMEFFFNAANTTGSPFNRREDVYYNVGCSSGQSVWETGDYMFFVGVDSSGSLGVYQLDQYQPIKISTGKIDSFISQATVKEGFTTFGSGFSAQGHTFYVLTIATEDDVVIPQTSLVYDNYAKLWYQWDYNLLGNQEFSLIAWSTRQGVTERFGEGILTTGDIITVNDNLVPVDTENGTGYVASGYVSAGYVEAVSDVGDNISMTIRTGMTDFGSHLTKYPLYLSVIQDTTEHSDTLTVKWSDENNKNFNTGRSLSTDKYQRARRIGKFRRRNHQIEYSGDQYLKLEAIELPTGQADD